VLAQPVITVTIVKEQFLVSLLLVKIQELVTML
jgi:hypothetical protein